MAMIVVWPEFAFAKAPNCIRAAVKKTFVYRNRSCFIRGICRQRVNNADPRAECDGGLLQPPLKSTASLIFGHTGRDRLRRKWQVIACTHRAADIFDIASQSARCQVDRVFDQEPPWVHILTLPHVQRVGKSDGIY